MSEERLQRLRDAMLQRALTLDETRFVADWLKAHPDRAAEWRAEAALSGHLRRLPPVPVSSNFTARVVAEVRREAAQAGRRRAGWRMGRQWGWPRVVAGLAVVLLLAAGGWVLDRQERRAQQAQELAALRAMATLPPQVLEDFDAIQRFADSTLPVDFELLAALE